MDLLVAIQKFGELLLERELDWDFLRHRLTLVAPSDCSAADQAIRIDQSLHDSIFGLTRVILKEFGICLSRRAGVAIQLSYETEASSDSCN